MLDLPKAITRQGPRRQGARSDVPMWHYWRLEEGTLGVDPDMQKTNDGRDAAGHPCRHRRAALFRSRRQADHRQALGHLLQARLPFRRRPGRRHALQGRAGARRGAVDPYGPESPEFVVGDDFADMWSSALAHCQKRFEGQMRSTSEENSGGIGCFTPGQFSGLRRFPRERLCHRRLQSRLQDDRRGQARGAGVAGREERAARAVPLLALRRGRAASGLDSPFPWS